MCGRFDIDLSNKDIDRYVSQLPAGSPPLKQGEIFPTNNALTLIMHDGKPTPAAMAWGFPRWDGKGVLFNARAETALQKPMFKKALLQFPAVIPASGFFEWKQDPDTALKEKFRFTAPEGRLLYLAGIWNLFPNEGAPNRFTILTTAANSSMLPYHSRMPVLLQPNELELWLNGAIRNEVLARTPEGVAASPAQ